MRSDYVYLFVGAILTGVISFWFRIREAKKALHLKDMRAHIDAVYEITEDIDDLSSIYFRGDPKSPEVEAAGLKIKSKIKILGSRIGAIHKSINNGVGTNDFELLTKLIEFRRSVTLDYFDDASRGILKANDAKFEKISTAASRLKEAIESIYDAKK